MRFRGTGQALPGNCWWTLGGWCGRGLCTARWRNLPLTVRFINAKSDHPIVWSKDFMNSSSDLLSSEREMAQSIANELSLTISPQTQAHLTRAPSVRSSAPKIFYLQGMVAFESENFLDGALDISKERSRWTPTLPILMLHWPPVMGGCGIADKCRVLRHFRIRRVTLCAPSNWMKRCRRRMRSWPMLSSMQTGIGAARREIRRALALNPNSATVHERYASYLLFTGRSDRRMDESGIAVKLDALSETAQNNVAYVYTFRANTTRHFCSE